MHSEQALPPHEINDSYFSLDVLLMGGFSILTCIGAWLFFDKAAPVTTVANFAFAAAFVVNHPHFLSSYMLMYGDFRKKIAQRKRYFFSAVIVPVVLLGLLFYGMYYADRALMGHMVTGMYFLVGWHYVKQVFGFVVVTAAHRKNYYTAKERYILLLNLFAIWFLSFLGSHVYAGSFDFYGIPHHSLNLPSWFLTADQALVSISLAGVIALHIQRYIKKGVKPSPPGVAAFVALYVWYIPFFAHPGFAYMIPFFHSLQYLAFVWLFKKRQVNSEIHAMKDEEWRMNWIKKFGGFALGALVLGALVFQIIPSYLDSMGLFPADRMMGYSPFLAAFLLFINIHHYFIDNTIWRSDNEAVKKYLF